MTEGKRTRMRTTGKSDEQRREEMRERVKEAQAGKKRIHFEIEPAEEKNLNEAAESAGMKRTVFIINALNSYAGKQIITPPVAPGSYDREEQKRKQQEAGKAEEAPARKE